MINMNIFLIFIRQITDYNKKGESLVNQYNQTQTDYAKKIQEYTDYQNQMQNKAKEIEGF